MRQNFTDKQQEYYEKLKDPRWQILRLKVFERDDFCCQNCYDPDSTLTVHHKNYIPNTEPWEYPIEFLITLCESCHKKEREDKKQQEEILLHAIRENFLVADMETISNAFHGIFLSHSHEIVATILEWALQSKEIMCELNERYWEYISKESNRRRGTL
jgi:hypothetical protein